MGGEKSSIQDQVRMAPPDPKSPRLLLNSEYDNVSSTFLSSYASKTETINELSLDDATDELVELDEKGEEVHSEVIVCQEKDAGINSIHVLILYSAYYCCYFTQRLRQFYYFLFTKGRDSNFDASNEDDRDLGIFLCIYFILSHIKLIV